MLIKYGYITGWWLSPTPLKNDGLKVSWDDYSIPNIWENKSHAPKHQPAILAFMRNEIFLPFWF